MGNEMNAKTRGLGYRRSKLLDDLLADRRTNLLWGETVVGSDEGDGWLKVQLKQEVKQGKKPAKDGRKAAEESAHKTPDNDSSESDSGDGKKKKPPRIDKRRSKTDDASGGAKNKPDKGMH